MNSHWSQLTGSLSFEERELINFICNEGLRETRILLKTGEHETGKARTEGAILAFETIEEQQFTTCEHLIDQWRKLGERCDKLRNQDQQIVAYWKMRGQQLQLDFIIERILALRVLTKQINAPMSARAAIYIQEWLCQETIG